MDATPARVAVSAEREAGVGAKKRTGRLPMLDGLRAISILLVVFSHLQATRGFPAFTWINRAVGDLGELGVRVFFVISGFLITHLLLEEQRRTGRISLSDFYARRVIRILPALAVFLVAMWVAERLSWIKLASGDWLHALTLTMDYSPHPGWSVGHLWSLSVEEQFYLLWPALLAVLGIGRAFGVATAVVVLLPILRILLWVYTPSYREYMDQSFETVADALAAGCLLAGLRSVLGRNRSYLKVLRSPGFVLVPALVFFVNGQEGHPIAFMLAGETVMNVGIALVLDWSLRHDEGWVGRVFESRPSRFVGTRSYSLYLWQEPFLNHRSSALATAFPLNLVLACIAAALSFTFIERPFARLRSRFAR